MYLLDTSAILASCFDEPGADLVDGILYSGQAYVAAVTWLELRIRLNNETEAKVREAVQTYENAVAGTVDINRQIAFNAFELRKDAGVRIPAIDALIAAAAKVCNFQLIHRDPHFAAIPSYLLNQKMLPIKSK